MPNMEKHLKHLRYLEAALAKAVPNTEPWWKIKGQLEQVRIAYAQAWNMATGMMSNRLREKFEEADVIKGDIDYWQSYFYYKLTEPLSVLINEAKKK